MAYIFVLLLNRGFNCQILVSLTDCSFTYDHFQKTQQLAQGQGKIEVPVNICCIGISGKAARSVCPKVDLLLHRNVWKRLKCTLDVTRARSLHTFA